MITVGDRATYVAGNGHLYEAEVTSLNPETGRSQYASTWNAIHQAECGCNKEPWEYDPIEDW